MAIDVPALLVRVPRTASASLTDAELYEAARKAWKIGAVRRAGGAAAPQVALAVVGGRVAAGWTIDSWEPHPVASGGLSAHSFLSGSDTWEDWTSGTCSPSARPTRCATWTAT